MIREKPRTKIPAPTIEPNAVYTREEAAELLRCNVEWISKQVAAGKIRKKDMGGRGRYLGRWLLDFLESADAAEETNRRLDSE